MCSRIIKSLPFVIDQAGSYKISKNLNFNVECAKIALDGIVVAVNDVCIDLKCHTLNVHARAAIHIQEGISNVTIRNGTIRNTAFPAEPINILTTDPILAAGLNRGYGVLIEDLAIDITVNDIVFEDTFIGVGNRGYTQSIVVENNKFWNFGHQYGTVESPNPRGGAVVIVNRNPSPPAVSGVTVRVRNNIGTTFIAQAGIAIAGLICVEVKENQFTVTGTPTPGTSLFLNLAQLPDVNVLAPCEPFPPGTFTLPVLRTDPTVLRDISDYGVFVFVAIFCYRIENNLACLGHTGFVLRSQGLGDLVNNKVGGHAQAGFDIRASNDMKVKNNSTALSLPPIFTTQEDANRLIGTNSGIVVRNSTGVVLIENQTNRNCEVARDPALLQGFGIVIGFPESIDNIIKDNQVVRSVNGLGFVNGASPANNVVLDNIVVGTVGPLPLEIPATI